MKLPGWGTVWGVGAKLLDSVIPSKKGALSDKLAKLNKRYQKALRDGRDTDAAVLRKQMVKLREKAGLTDGEM